MPANLDWHALVDPAATTAVYMAMRTLAELRDKLISTGLSPATPAFAMINVSRAGEQIIASTIADLPDAIAAANVNGPCLVLFGEALRGAGRG